MKLRSISGINRLPVDEKESIYISFIPEILLDRFHIPSDFTDPEGNRLLKIHSDPGSADFSLRLKSSYADQDPLLYAHVTDTLNRQIHVLLYIVNDPTSPRFDVDVMPDGSSTRFGIFRRNIQAEELAMKAGLAPGQIRRGLRVLKHSIKSFETFAIALGHDLFFIEPLYYHIAVIFERYGFSYMKGRRFMESINFGFEPEESLIKLLDFSSPFRLLEQARSIRGRSWAIHDGILGHAFTDVIMYKAVGKAAGINTFPNSKW